MTTLEKRAREACQDIERNGGCRFQVYWAESSSWGFCPRIEWRGKKAAHASGCGYDKLSAVISEFLSPLVPEVARCSGAGISSVTECLAKNGWKLEHTYDGKKEDGFALSKT